MHKRRMRRDYSREKELSPLRACIDGHNLHGALSRKRTRSMRQCGCQNQTPPASFSLFLAHNYGVFCEQLRILRIAPLFPSQRHGRRERKRKEDATQDKVMAMSWKIRSAPTAKCQSAKSVRRDKQDFPAISNLLPFAAISPGNYKI